MTEFITDSLSLMKPPTIGSNRTHPQGPITSAIWNDLSRATRRSGAIFTSVFGLLALNSARAAEWSCGFEPSEGYTSGQSPAGAQVSVLGGDATVLSGSAAEGTQFVRFFPRREDNGFILKLGAAATDDSERTIRFAVRLIGEAESTRLVLSYGQTVALRPVAGGVQVEVSDGAPRTFAVKVADGGWLSVGIREVKANGTWDLLLGDQTAVAGLPMQDPFTLLSDLLIFADGSLDLDAVKVVTTPAGLLVETPDGEKKGTPANGNARVGTDGKTARLQGELLSLAMQDASRGDMAKAEQGISLLTRGSPETGEWNFDMAQQLSMFAYALHGEGRYRQATIVARESLRYLDLARSKPFDSKRNEDRAVVEFVYAQILEGILWDTAGAEAKYRSALSIDGAHRAAREALDKISAATAGPNAGKGGRP
jgi:hypothetical protein